MKKILDNDFYDLTIYTASIPAFDTGDNITYVDERHALLHLPRTGFNPCSMGTHPYYSFPPLYTLESTVSIEKSGIGTVQRNPFLKLFGKGVLLGFIDTGIDYQHQAFRNNDGTTRIVSIWDQTIQEGSPPEGFTFGTEYNQELINLALDSEDPLSIVPATDTNGHGTAIASIAAGTANEDQSFLGVAQEASIAVVKLKEAKQNLKNIYFVPEDTYCFQESDINFGVHYLESVSRRVNLPLVICIALGTSHGGHDGFGILSSLLNYITQLTGIGAAVSAGNEGNKRRHYYNSTPVEPYYNDFELKVGSNEHQFSMEIWSKAPSILTVDISTPNRESSQQIYPTMGQCKKYDFIFTQSTVWVNNDVLEILSGNQMILIRFNNPSAGIWSFRVQSVVNEPFIFNSWLPSGNLISDNTFFLNSNPNTTITNPGNGIHQLTVTAYNQFTNAILAQSSRGYTSNEQAKPDIAAPGFQIPCALPGDQYGTLTGTGAAAAHTAGVMAMLMEWAIPKGNYPFMTGYDINRLLMRGAKRSVSESYPNNLWGYGQLDINNLFERLTNI